MGLPVRVPHHMVINKPRHGEPCNRCGVCCYATLCELGQKVFRQKRGPCPALAPGGEPGRFACGLLGCDNVEAREAAALLIGSGTGCDARINGEPRNMAFVAELEKLDEQNADRVRAARRLWRMK